MDYLDRLDTQYNTPETWHDHRPSHFKRPAWLIEAAEAADQAWLDHDQFIESELFGCEFTLCDPRYELISEAREAAEEAAAHYSEMYERWQKELAEKLEVEG